MKVYGIVALALVSSVACGDGSRVKPDGSGAGSSPAAETITVYSGRNEKLIAPLIARFEQESGITVRVRYGDTAELAATLMEEGKRTPADVFVSQDGAALGAVSRAGMFVPLSADLQSAVPARFRSSEGDWVGISGRARSIVYDPARIRVDELPESLVALGHRRYHGRFGLAPANGSFQAHMAVYHAVNGREALENLLRSLVANDPRRYPKNNTIVEAVMRGEIDFGLVNHYYTWQAKTEYPDASVENFFMPEGEASSFVNVAGAGILKQGDAAERFVRFLLSDGAQQYFATETFEYPLVEGVEPSIELQPLGEIRTPDVSMSEVSDLIGDTLVLIQRTGLLR
jgi:iron(III) transport system substrate-binding protein